MLSPFLKRIVIDVLLVLAFALGAFYIYNVFLDFLISLFHFSGTRNISSISYCIFRILHILVPLIMLTALKNKRKLKTLKAMYFIMGLCFLLANFWLVHYFIDNPPMDIFMTSIPRWFVSGDLLETVNEAYQNVVKYQYDNALVFNYLVWDSYDLFGVLFSTIQGILLIRFSLILDHHRYKVFKSFIVLTLTAFLLPWIYNILVQKNWFFTSAWSSKNFFLIFESLFVLIAMGFTATSRVIWYDVIW